MGGYPTYWEAPGEIPSQSGENNGRDTTSEIDKWDLVIPPTRR